LELRGLTVLVFLFLASACTNDEGPQTAARLALSPPWTSIEVGDSIIGDTVRATFVDAAGVVVPAGSVVWSSTNTAVAPDATPAPEYGVCFDSTWGRHQARIRPAPGEDDRRNNTLDDYLDYFGAAAHSPTGYYSYDLGAWHVVVLNATPAVDPTQLSWLIADLAANAALCTVAIAHRPRFSSGNAHSAPGQAALFQVLYDAGVELLVSGNDHDYERFAPPGPRPNTRPRQRSRAIRGGDRRQE